MALDAAEACSGAGSKDDKRDIIANLFRSVIVLSPHELSELFYFLSVRLSPEYEGIEINVGQEILFKSIMEAF